MVASRWLRFLLLLPCIIALLPPASAAPPITTEAFLASPGAIAFKAGKFEEALTGFQDLLKQHPDDPVILRYIGITYDRLERFEEAVATFEKALTLDPKNPALHFFLGVTLFKMREAKKAKEALRRAMELGPDTVYASRAKQYLDVMEQQKAQGEAPGGPKRWDLFFQTGFQFDDNIPSAPRKKELFIGPDREGFRVTEYLTAGYRVIQDEGWIAKVEFSSYQAQYPEEDLQGFNLSTYQPGLEVSYATTLAGMPFSTSLRYDFNDVLLKGDDFSRSSSVTVKVNISATDFWIISPLYRFTFDRFNDDGFDPKFSSRDATNNAGGLTQYLLFWDRQAHVRAGYEFYDNKAEGLNFDALGHKGTVGLSLPVIEEIRLDVSGEHSSEKSIHFQGPRERRTKQQVYSAGLSRTLWDLFLISFSYQYTFANSNYAELEYIREVFSFTVSVSF